MIYAWIRFKEYGGAEPIVHRYGPFAEIECGEYSIDGITRDGKRQDIVQLLEIGEDVRYWTPDFGKEWVGRSRGKRWLSDPVVYLADASGKQQPQAE